MNVFCPQEYMGLCCDKFAGHEKSLDPQIATHEHRGEDGHVLFRWRFKNDAQLDRFAGGEPLEDDLKMCKNKRCGRHKTLVNAPNRRYCSECGAKLRNSWGHDLDPNSPPLLDPGPDSPPTKGRRGFKPMSQTPPTQPTNGKIIQLGPATTEAFEPLSWSQFKGTHDEYVQYRIACSKGEITDNTPYMYQNWKDSRNRMRANTTPVVNDTFTCDGDIKGCPVFKAKEKNRLIMIPNEMYNNWVWLTHKFDTEWIAYLKGTQDAETKVWTLSEMYFPKQKANGAHVDAEDGQIVEGTIGSVHSHVGMGAFFSQEDEKHFNHPVEIVVNRKGELAMCVRLQLECGRYSRVDTECLLVGNSICAALAADLKSKLSADTGYTSYGGGH